MNNQFYFAIIFILFLLVSCGGGTESIDSNSEYTFDELIELRLSDTSKIDGNEIRINNNIQSYFTAACPAVVPLPCVDPELILYEDLTQYEVTNMFGHSKNSYDSCQAGFISIVSENSNNYEYLKIDYSNHQEFNLITVDKSIQTTFLAKIEFTDEIDYCDKKIYKGMSITLSEGEHQNILELFIN